ncbi:MAG: nuclear transport factor 2 family protein, partial [Acidimicrobiales bacterium]
MNRDTGMPDTAAGRVVRALFDAIEARDLAAVESMLAPDASWRNVPHPIADGRPAVLSMLGPILAMSDEVEWEILAGADAGGGVVLLERIDHFTIAGRRHGVPCNGAFVADIGAGLVTEVRDYTDLGVWREQIAPVYAAWAGRKAIEVVSRHLAGVERRDPVAMAADYAPDAVLNRAGEEHRGVAAIRRYFDSVPERLGT